MTVFKPAVSPQLRREEALLNLDELTAAIQLLRYAITTGDRLSVSNASQIRDDIYTVFADRLIYDDSSVYYDLFVDATKP